MVNFSSVKKLMQIKKVSYTTLPQPTTVVPLFQDFLDYHRRPTTFFFTIAQTAKVRVNLRKRVALDYTAACVIARALKV